MYTAVFRGRLCQPASAFSCQADADIYQPCRRYAQVLLGGLLKRCFVANNQRCVNSCVSFDSYAGVSRVVGVKPSEGRISHIFKGVRPMSTEAEVTDEAERRSENTYKFPRLGKRALKKVRSIERLYRPSVTEANDKSIIAPYTITTPDTTKAAISNKVLPQEEDVVPKEYEQTKHLVRSIYKSATSGVYNDALWNRYLHKLSIVAGILKPPDICIVMYSFARVRYRHQLLMKVMSPLIVRNMGNLSSAGAALMLNSMKRLELRNYDIIELATNEVCLKIDHANLQDIALTANALSFFHIYHNRFWNMLTKAVSLRHHQATALQASLLLAAVAKMDIRNPLLLRLLKDKLRSAITKGELNQELLTLCFHSLAKLGFIARNFYDASVEKFGEMLSKEPEKLDSQSLVLYLYTAVCMLDIPDETIEKSLKLIANREEILKNYKALKLKYVFDHLKAKRGALVESFDTDIRELQRRIEEYQPEKVQRKLSRWAMEVSRLLQSNGVKHKRNVLFGYIYVDILLKDNGVAIKCAGPYSYYAMSNNLTVFTQVEIDTLTMKGVKVCTLPYYEWNALRTEKDKLEYLKKFGESWASVHLANATVLCPGSSSD